MLAYNFLCLGGESQGKKVAAATYLKNFTRRSINDDGTSSSKASKEFKDQLMRALLQVEPAVLKVLVEVVCLFLSCHSNFPFSTISYVCKLWMCVLAVSGHCCG